VIFFTFFPLDLVLDDRTSGVAGIRPVRRNGEDRVVSDLEAKPLGPDSDSSESGRALADPLDVLADDIDIEAHGALQVPEHAMIRNPECILLNLGHDATLLRS
jgi:hypothetical protein